MPKLNDMPIGVLATIFSYLDLADIQSLTRTSKGFKRVITTDPQMKEIYQKTVNFLFENRAKRIEQNTKFEENFSETLKDILSNYAISLTLLDQRLETEKNGFLISSENPIYSKIQALISNIETGTGYKNIRAFPFDKLAKHQLSHKNLILHSLLLLSLIGLSLSIYYSSQALPPTQIQCEQALSVLKKSFCKEVTFLHNCAIAFNVVEFLFRTLNECDNTDDYFVYPIHAIDEYSAAQKAYSGNLAWLVISCLALGGIIFGIVFKNKNLYNQVKDPAQYRDNPIIFLSDSDQKLLSEIKAVFIAEFANKTTKTIDDLHSLLVKIAEKQPLRSKLLEECHALQKLIKTWITQTENIEKIKDIEQSEGKIDSFQKISSKTCRFFKAVDEAKAAAANDREVDAKAGQVVMEIDEETPLLRKR